jgi:hypothetical protein
MPLGGAYLLFDQIEVIEQPFARRRNPALGLACRRQQLVGLQQYAFVLGQAREQLIRTPLRAQAVRARQGLAMLLHLIGAEQLRPQRWRIAGKLLLCQVIAAQARPQTGPGFAYVFAA